MKPKIKVDANSLKKTLATLQKFGDESARFISEATQTAANEIRDGAMSNVRSQDITEAVGPIVVEQTATGGDYYTINAQNVPLAAYYEFGTGAFVEVADEWKGLAWEFYKNGRGTLQPHPFLYPAFREGRERYQKDLELKIKQLAEKYSK